MYLFHTLFFSMYIKKIALLFVSILSLSLSVFLPQVDAARRVVGRSYYSNYTLPYRNPVYTHAVSPYCSGQPYIANAQSYNYGYPTVANQTWVYSTNG